MKSFYFKLKLNNYDIADLCGGEDVELCIGLLPYKIEVVKTTPPEG